MKKVIIAFVVIVAIVASGAAAYFFGLAPAKKALLENAEIQIKSKYKIGANVSDIAFDFPSAITLKNIAVTDAQSGAAILEAESIRADLAPLLLLKGGIGIKKVTCEGASFHYERAPDGSTNIDKVLGRGEGGGRSRAMTLALRESNIIFLDRKSNPGATAVSIDVADAVINARADGSTKINVTSARYGASDFSVKGTFKAGASGAMSLRIDSTAFNVSDLKSLISAVSGLDTSSVKNLEAPLTTRIDITGAQGDETISISVSAAEGAVGSDALERFRLKGKIKRDMIDFDAIQIRLASGGSITGSVKMPLAEGGEADIDVKAKDFPVGIVADIIEGWNPGISGALTANARARGSLTAPKSLKGKCEFTVADGFIPDMIGGDSMPYENIQGMFEMKDGSLALERFALRSDQMDMDLKGTIDLVGGSLNLKGRAEVAKDKVRSAGVKKMVAGLLPDGEKGYVFNMRIEGDFGAPQVKFSPLKTVYRGMEDKVRDSANSVEKLIKKIF